MKKTIAFDGHTIGFEDFSFEDDGYGYINDVITLDFGNFHVDCEVAITIKRTLCLGEDFLSDEYEYSDIDVTIGDLMAFDVFGDELYFGHKQRNEVCHEIINFLCNLLLY